MHDPITTRDLGDPLGRHARLVVEDAPEVLAVGEDLRLQREERSARVDEVDAGQVVLLGHLLRPQVLLHRERVVRAAFHGRVVRDDQAVPSLDDPDARHDARRGRVAVVDAPGGEGVELEEGAARVDEEVDPLAGGELAAGAVPFDGDGAATTRDELRPLPELGDERLHPPAPLLEHGVAGDGARAASSRRPLQLDEQVAAGDAVALGDVERGDAPVERRGDRQLHLHRLEHHELLPRGDGVAGRDLHVGHGAGHRGDDVAAALSGMGLGLDVDIGPASGAQARGG